MVLYGLWPSWRDEGASLVGHFVPRRPFVPDDPIVTAAHQHYDFPRQQPVQESVYKQHCWVSCCVFVRVCVSIEPQVFTLPSK